MKKVYVVFYKSQFVGIWMRMSTMCNDLLSQHQDARSYSWISKLNPKELPGRIAFGDWIIKVEPIK